MSHRDTTSKAFRRMSAEDFEVDDATGKLTLTNQRGDCLVYLYNSECKACPIMEDCILALDCNHFNLTLACHELTHGSKMYDKCNRDPNRKIKAVPTVLYFSNSCEIGYFIPQKNQRPTVELMRTFVSRFYKNVDPVNSSTLPGMDWRAVSTKQYRRDSEDTGNEDDCVTTMECNQNVCTFITKRPEPGTPKYKILEKNQHAR